MMDSGKQKKTSLRGKIIGFYLSVSVVLSLVLGSISVYMVDRLADTDSKQIMTQLCEKEAIKFDNKLNNVKESVDVIYNYARDLQQQNESLDVYSTEYEERVKDFAVAIANQTEGAMTVYFRYNPEQTGSGTDGFFWSKHVDSDVFVEEQPTDIFAYNSSDVEHVGWFYTPKETGKPLWMSPYYNQNLDIFMISYIIPLYQRNGEFIGVLGMDIDFITIILETHGGQLYRSGKVALADLQQRLVYYTDETCAVQTEKLSKTLYNHITTINKLNDLLEVTDVEGNTSVICCRKLCNGMMIYVNVSKSEIDRNRNALIMFCIIATIFIFCISTFYVWNRTKKIVYPLEKLTETTQKYAQGDWSCQYISETGDEIQELSESISKMAKNTQEYFKKLNDLVRTDAVTGIGNKVSYVELVTEIKNNKYHRYDEYAVVSFDLNLLKKTNDNYGHEIGDLLIKEAASYICGIFSNSPVFRTGGDEFVAILHAEDYRNRAELLERFEKEMNYALEKCPQVFLSISYGMAERSHLLPDYDSVYGLADERMYRKKKEMKMERGD